MKIDTGGAESLWPSSLGLHQACEDAVLRLLRLYPNMGSDIETARKTLSVMCSELPDMTMGQGPVPGYYFGLDGSPLDVSIRFGGGEPKLRWEVYTDAKIDRLDMSAAAATERWDAGLRVAKRLHEQFGADLSLTEKVADILRPDEGGGDRLWFGISTPLGNRPQFQVYFRSHPRSMPKIYEAAKALGVQSFADKLWPILGARGIISLTGFEMIEREPRVKFYVVIPTAAVFEEVRELAGDYFPLDDVDGIFKELYREDVEFPDASPLFAFHLKGGAVSATTAYLPVNPFHVDLASGDVLTDGDLLARLIPVLRHRGIPTDDYVRAVEAFAVTKLDHELCLHQFFALVRDKTGLQATMYLCPRFYMHRFGIVE